jgi:hypothetical protein
MLLMQTGSAVWNERPGGDRKPDGNVADPEDTLFPSETSSDVQVGFQISLRSAIRTRFVGLRPHAFDHPQTSAHCTSRRS